MNNFVDSLLGHRSLDLRDPGVGLGFEHPLPVWAWVIVVGAAMGLAGWSYWRLTGAAWMRTLLALVRTATLLLVVVLLLGPEAVKHNESSERDWVLVLADRSASLNIADAPRDAAGGTPGATTPERETREAQLRAALTRSGPMWRKLAQDKQVLWLGFAAGAFDLAGSKEQTQGAAPPVDLGAPTGQRTAIGAALEQALARVAARPVSGVVVLSDGRSVDEPSRSTLRRLEGEHIPVHVVPLGAASPVGDILVRRAEIPSVAFINDPVPVRVEVERIGGAGESRGTVRLIDKTTGQTLEEKPFVLPAAAGATGSDKPGETPRQRAGPPSVVQAVTLTHALASAGDHQWVVEVVPESRAADLVGSNNAAEVSVQTIDRPMRVLYIDGYPRWEERYLKNLLVREKSISCSTLILAPDKKFTQEGDVEIDALPDTPERWAEYDAVILGDVRPDVFTREQLSQLRDHVAKRGAGLVWIAGSSSVPTAWWGTPLGDLLPFTKDAVDGGTLGVPALLQPMPAADRLGLLHLGDEGTDPWPPALSSFDTSWALLQWVQRIEPRYVKPTAEALAVARTRTKDGADAPADPVLLQMKYGAGRVVYCATDETWRWRYARGEALYERFWTPILRLLGRDALSRSGMPALLSISSEQGVVDQPVKVSLELLDQSLSDLGLGSIIVRLTRHPDAGSGGPEATPPWVDLTLRAEGGQSRVYSTIWNPPEAGLWTGEVADGALAGQVRKGQVAASIRVSLPDDELRQPEADHEFLERLSTQTGGKVFTPENLFELPAHLPNRAVRTVVDQTEPLSDTPLALILVVGLLTLEWVGRRVIRLI